MHDELGDQSVNVACTPTASSGLELQKTDTNPGGVKTVGLLASDQGEGGGLHVESGSSCHESSACRCTRFD